MNLDQFTEFMAWATAINLGLFIITAVSVMAIGGPISKIHGRLFGLDPDGIRSTYYDYIAIYKIVVLVFFVVPYLALRFGMGPA